MEGWREAWQRQPGEMEVELLVQGSTLECPRTEKRMTEADGGLPCMHPGLLCLQQQIHQINTLHYGFTPWQLRQGFPEQGAVAYLGHSTPELNHQLTLPMGKTKSHSYTSHYCWLGTACS